VSGVEVDGVATVVAPDGTVLVHEGEQSEIEFGGAQTGARFSVCNVGEDPHQVDRSAAG